MIDSRAVIDSSVEFEEDVTVGPFAVIGAGVRVGKGTVIGPHVVIKGPTEIGRENRIFQFASIGDDPQDKKYGGEPTRLVIGDRNVIREYCTINRGTVQDKGMTVIGDDNWIMAYTHIAHDCQIGNNTIFANSASLAGHVDVHDFAILGGFTLVHQFCAIGAHVFTGMGSTVAKDVPPYMMVSGNPARTHGINSEGLRRHGYEAEVIQELKRAYKTLFRSGLTVEQALQELREQTRRCGAVGELVNFLDRRTRGIIR